MLYIQLLNYMFTRHYTFQQAMEFSPPNAYVDLGISAARG
jgi:hypothetical protein